MTISLEEHAARLKKALEPFAELALGIPDTAHDVAPAFFMGQDARHPGTFTTINNGAFRRARAAIAAVREREGAEKRVRHKKRGTTYRVIEQATIQTEQAIGDNEPVVIYQCETDGRFWARPPMEFYDGRFEDLPAIPSPDPAEAMRAKCEAIARQEADEYAVEAQGESAALSIADAIAALKGKGEG